MGTFSALPLVLCGYILDVRPIYHVEQTFEWPGIWDVIKLTVMRNMTTYPLDKQEQISVKFESKYKKLTKKAGTEKSLPNGSHFVWVSLWLIAVYDIHSDTYRVTICSLSTYLLFYNRLQIKFILYHFTQNYYWISISVFKDMKIVAS